MSDTIGKLSVLLSANTQAFNSAIDQASGKFSKFLGSISSMSFVTKIPYVGPLLAAGQALAGFLDGFIEKQLRASRGAATLGVSVETYLALEKAAKKSGVEVEGLAVAMTHQARAIQHAAAGNAEAQNAFRLLNLSVNDLRGLSADKQFEAIGAALRGIQDPMTRVTVATSLYGRAGHTMIPMLLEAGDKIAAARKEVQKLGSALTSEELNKLKEIKATGFEKMKEQIEASIARIVIALNPLFKALIDGWERIQPIVKAVFSYVQGVIEAWVDVATAVFEEVGEAIDSLRDYFEPVIESISGLTEGFTNFKDLALDVLQAVARGAQIFVNACTIAFGAVLKFAITPLVTGFRMLMEGVTAVVKFLAKIPVVGKVFKGAAEGLDQFATKVKNIEERMNSAGEALMGQNLTDTSNVDNFFDRIRENNRRTRNNVAANNPLGPIVDPQLLADINKLQGELQKQIDTFGMSSDQVKRWELVQRGATAAQLEQVDALLKQKAALEYLQQLTKDAESLTEQLKTPAEKFGSEMDKLDEMLERGLISYETYSRGVVAALEKIKSAQQDISIQGNQAMLAGSSQAQATINRSRMDSQLNSRENVMQRLLGEQRDLQASQLREAQELTRLIREREDREV